MTTIAVVHSTAFSAEFQTCFMAGVTASGAVQPITITHTPFEAHGEYRQLPTLMRNAADTHPDLIVAAGGLIAANAAATVLIQSNGDPQFVYLSGVSLTGNNPCNSGGVNLNVSIENSVRRALLTGNPYNLDPARIYLVVNNNAPMSAQEATSWGANSAAFFPTGPNPLINTNDTTAGNHFIHEFSVLASCQPKPLGLVISGDPYFRHWRTAFPNSTCQSTPCSCLLFFS